MSQFTTQLRSTNLSVLRELDLALVLFLLLLFPPPPVLAAPPPLLPDAIRAHAQEVEHPVASVVASKLLSSVK